MPPPFIRVYLGNPDRLRGGWVVIGTLLVVLVLTATAMLWNAPNLPELNKPKAPRIQDRWNYPVPQSPNGGSVPPHPSRNRSVP